MHSPDRTYITEPDKHGERIQVYWINGAQSCSIIPKGEQPNPRSIKDITGGKRQPKEILNTSPGDTVSLTYKQLRSEVLAGHKVFTRGGKRIPCRTRAEKTPDKVVKVTVQIEGKTKLYKLT